MDLPREDHRLVALACHSLSWDSASLPRGTGHRGFRDARESGLGGMDLGLLAYIQIQRLVPRASPSKWDGRTVRRGRSHEGLMESLALGIGLWTYRLVRECSNSCRSGYLYEVSMHPMPLEALYWTYLVLGWYANLVDSWDWEPCVP